MMMTGSSLAARSSIHVKSCATIRRSISRCAFSRLGVMASTSSRKRIHGAIFCVGVSAGLGTEVRIRYTLASSNVSLSVFSDSPDMPETMEGADTEMKGSLISYTWPSAFRSPAPSRLTPAKHLTSWVLPPPGTPWRRTPLGRGTPVWR